MCTREKNVFHIIGGKNRLRKKYHGMKIAATSFENKVRT